MVSYPTVRLRRLRRLTALRLLVAETRLSVDDFIAPFFVVPGTKKRQAISSLVGQFHLSVDEVLREAGELVELGIKGVLLFGLPDKKDALGSEALRDDGVVQSAIRALKEAFPQLVVIADLCFCEYTEHGHCGVLRQGELDNDLTLEELKKQALSLARAGADIIAPSGMIDGMVASIRSALDEAAFSERIIMSYSAKYASAYYGPFRIAAQSTPAFGDRRGYQMDPANALEALREVATDLEEGADIVMVKPALAYLDVIRHVKDRFPVPLAAYNVSGEYAMIQAAAEHGLIDGPRVMMETLLAIKRAGADIIISYFAKEAARLLRS